MFKRNLLPGVSAPVRNVPTLVFERNIASCFSHRAFGNPMQVCDGAMWAGQVTFKSVGIVVRRRLSRRPTRQSHESFKYAR